MKDIANWIGGLMKEMTNEIQPGCFSLIPPRTIQYQYIIKNRYVLQTDERGRAVGYILNGAMNYGSSVVITQHTIIYDRWLCGYGEQAFNTILNRAKQAGCSSIKLRCADDLPALQFWKSMGFQVFEIEPGGNKRQRKIVKMVYPLFLPLFVMQPEQAVMSL